MVTVRPRGPPCLRRFSKMSKHKLTIADLIEKTVDRLPSKVAIRFVNDGRLLTFAELDRGAGPAALSARRACRVPLLACPLVWLAVCAAHAFLV